MFSTFLYLLFRLSIPRRKNWLKLGWIGMPLAWDFTTSRSAPPRPPPSRFLPHLIGTHGRLAFLSCIVQVELWFGGMETPPSPADPQEPYPYDRLGNLKNTFFDIFADHQLDPPQLNYVDMVSGNKHILVGPLQTKKYRKLT